MMIKEIDLDRIFGLCGILAPIVGILAIFISISMVPWFSWSENYLSDLGGHPGSDCLWSTWGSASIVFNFGLVSAGCLGICFGVGLRRIELTKNYLGSIGASIIVLVACALVGVGLFTESTGSWHTFFSISFFILVGIALAICTIAFLKSGEKSLGVFSLGLLIFGMTAIPLFITPKPVGSNAIAEIIPIIALSIFTIVMGYRIFTKKGS